MKEIAHKLEAVNEKRRQESLPSILLHSDAAQAIGKVKVHVVDLKVNYLTVVGHKVAEREGAEAWVFVAEWGCFCSC